MPQWLSVFINNYLIKFVIDLLFAAIVLFVGFALVKLLLKAIGKMPFYKKLDINIQSFLNNFLGVALKILIVVTAVVILGVPQASVVAILGSCGIAIGLALQGGLSNIAGGIVLMISRPFHVGDFIEFNGTSGFVRDIGMYYTKIETPDGRDVTVPNSTLSNSTVDNLSVQKLRRVDFDFNVAYDTDIDFARKILLATASVNEQIEKTPAPEVFVSEYGEYAMKIKLRIYCTFENYWAVYFDTFESVKRAFDKFKIEIPYNHVNVTIDNKQSSEQ